MKRILLVDDDAGIQISWKCFHAVVEPVFRGQCELDCAKDLRQMGEKLNHSTYDAIILDLTLDINGPEETIKFIEKHHEELPPIMVLTGTEDIFIRRRCIISGAAGFWTKPDAMAFPNLFFKELYNEYLKRYAPSESREPAEV